MQARAGVTILSNAQLATTVMKGKESKNEMKNDVCNLLTFAEMGGLANCVHSFFIVMVEKREQHKMLTKKHKFHSWSNLQSIPLCLV